MQKENVIALRDALMSGNPDAHIQVICDNLYNFRTPNDILDWDDDNGVLRVLKTNEDYHHTVGERFQIITVEYDVIQYIMLDCGKITVERLCSELGFTEDNINKSKEFITTATTIKL